MKFEVYCRYEDFSLRLNFYIFNVDETGKKSFCTSIDKMEFEAYIPGQHVNKPTFCLKGPVTKPFLQAIANELKEIGIKPEDEPVLENELSAVKYHLEDMRKISFKKLEISYLGETK